MRLADGKRAPDFIIIGAMKSGTSSLHAVLASREDVFIPDKEVYFFDVDDIEQHPDFFIKTKKGWTFHDYEQDFETYYEWYTGFFDAATDHMLIGEDTTTYLASKAAPARIEKMLPDVKLIAMLRDPVTRAYSHYWHNVAAGRITLSFDDHLRHASGNTLARGFYKEHLSRYRSFVDSGQLKVVFFEDFVADKQGVVNDICTFLGLQGGIDLQGKDPVENSATVPLNIPLRLMANRLYKSVAGNVTLRNIPNMPGYRPELIGNKSSEQRLPLRMWDLYRQKLPSRKYPPMKQETRVFLEQLYRKRNRGLSDLIGQDVTTRWDYMK